MQAKFLNYNNTMFFFSTITLSLWSSPIRKVDIIIYEMKKQMNICHYGMII